MEAALALAPAPRAATLQTDSDLVAAVRRGDDRAFEELYARYHRRISSYIFGMVKDHARAEDLTQDVFMSALRRMRDTDRPIAFKPWVYEIAKNACIDQFRRQKRAEEVSYDAEEGLGAADYGRLVTGDPTPDVALDHKQQLDHLRGALGGLSDAHHQILVMREFEGLSYREIGERMNMSRPSVESTLFRARKRLTEEYEELITGARCHRIQSIMTSVGAGDLGARDRRRMARHLSYCQPCRRHAHANGLGEVVPERRPVGVKIAAFLPLPAFLRRRLLGDADAAAAAGGHGGSLAQWSANMGPMLDSAAGQWTKAVATAATLAVAGVGAGAATRPHAASLARQLDAGSLISLMSGKHAKSASRAATPLSAAATTGTRAVPPRSAAAAPTKGLGSTAPKEGAVDDSPLGPDPNAPAAAPKKNPDQGDGDAVGTLTRQMGLGGNGGSNGSGDQGSGDSDTSGNPGSGVQVPSVPNTDGVGVPSAAGLPVGGDVAKAGTDAVATVEQEAGVGGGGAATGDSSGGTLGG